MVTEDRRWILAERWRARLIDAQATIAKWQRLPVGRLPTSAEVMRLLTDLHHAICVLEHVQENYYGEQTDGE